MPKWVRVAAWRRPANRRKTKHSLQSKREDSEDNTFGEFGVLTVGQIRRNKNDLFIPVQLPIFSASRVGIFTGTGQEE
jgi:hypothetical protein